MQCEYLIVGMGICGTLLSRRLLQEGKSVLIIDNGSPTGASRCAGGIMNPVTGMRMVRSWMAEELIPTAVKEYEAIGRDLGANYVEEMPIVEFLHSYEQQELFTAKLDTETDYLQTVTDEKKWLDLFSYQHGVGMITGSYHLQVGSLLDAWRQKMTTNNFLISEEMDMGAIMVSNDGVRYNGINAEKIIFCDGAHAANNIWFERLPWSKDKGEALIAEIPNLPPDVLYKQSGLTIAPWQNGLYWVGAAHDWKYTSPLPSEEFRTKTIAQLNEWLRIPYKIVDHIAALRPANLDRKPFVGLHPIINKVGILNGMGGKGFTMAPYFAAQLSDHLTKGSIIMPHADVQRYKRVLSNQ